ncbi:hypothetical protein FAI40_08715 [Acetobacteraceae bacterium]|nr:hypothetical protein FAI40_08715 [Acetobacteraceae bacterium]
MKTQTTFFQLYENAISNPHSYLFVFIGYFLVLGVCAFMTIKTLKTMRYYAKQIKSFAPQQLNQ